MATENYIEKWPQKADGRPKRSNKHVICEIIQEFSFENWP